MESPFGRLPAELYLFLLDCLNVPDTSGQASSAIYNLATCSLSMYELVNRWASYIMTDKIAKVSHFEKRARVSLLETERHYPRVGMHALCQRLAGFCDFCGQLKKLWDSPDGQLQACEVCYIVLVPMISRERFEFLYALSDPAVDIEEVLPKYQHWSITGVDVRDGIFFLRQDVKDLAERGLVKLTTPQNQETSWYWERSEYYGLFQISPEHQSSDESGLKYWSDKLLCLQLDSHYRDSLSQRFLSLCPIIMEMMLLNHFRFRFDPKWRRPWGTDKEDVLQYARIAGRWSGSTSDWHRRPWRFCNLPSFTGCLITTNPYQSVDAKKGSVLWLQEYVDRCQQTRRVMEIFPAVLYYPRTWGMCIGPQGRRVHDAINNAQNAQLSWLHNPHHVPWHASSDKKIILAKKVGTYDVYIPKVWGHKEMVDIIKDDGTVDACDF
jgi:hypothetical protein